MFQKKKNVSKKKKARRIIYHHITTDPDKNNLLKNYTNYIYESYDAITFYIKIIFTVLTT